MTAMVTSSFTIDLFGDVKEPTDQEETCIAMTEIAQKKTTQVVGVARSSVPPVDAERPPFQSDDADVSVGALIIYEQHVRRVYVKLNVFTIGSPST